MNYQSKNGENRMKVLIACEESGTIVEAFRNLGFTNVWSCDILPTSGKYPEWHIQDDVLKHLDDGWDLMIAHPPCTYLANSGVQHLKDNEERKKLMREAREFFMKLLNAPIEKIAVENPVPHKYADLPKYSQIIQPYEHGHEVMKKTCLWLKNLPLIKPTKIVGKGKKYIMKNGKSNGSYWYQRLTPGKNRAVIRSRTFPGIAKAMAEQWGNLI